MKKYVSQMTPEEVIKLLKEGYAIKDNYNKYTKYRMIDGILFDEAEIRLNCTLILDDEDLYFEIEEETIKEPFEITKPGVYKTRNGLKAYISFVDGNDAIGVIENYSCLENWEINGIHYDRNNAGLDIVSKWND